MLAERALARRVLTGLSLALACAWVSAAPSSTDRADQTQAPISEDEAALLRASSGRMERKPFVPSTEESVRPPADLDGATLQQWFDHRYGASKEAASPLATVLEVDDAQAEAALLDDIERRRRE